MESWTQRGRGGGREAEHLPVIKQGGRTGSHHRLPCCSAMDDAAAAPPPCGLQPAHVSREGAGAADQGASGLGACRAGEGGRCWSRILPVSDTT